MAVPQLSTSQYRPGNVLDALRERQEAERQRAENAELAAAAEARRPEMDAIRDEHEQKLESQRVDPLEIHLPTEEEQQRPALNRAVAEWQAGAPERDAARQRMLNQHDQMQPRMEDAQAARRTREMREFRSPTGVGTVSGQAAAMDAARSTATSGLNYNPPNPARDTKNIVADVDSARTANAYKSSYDAWEKEYQAAQYAHQSAMQASLASPGDAALEAAWKKTHQRLLAVTESRPAVPLGVYRDEDGNSMDAWESPEYSADGQNGEPAWITFENLTEDEKEAIRGQYGKAGTEDERRARDERVLRDISMGYGELPPKERLAILKQWAANTQAPVTPAEVKGGMRGGHGYDGGEFGPARYSRNPGDPRPRNRIRDPKVYGERQAGEDPYDMAPSRFRPNANVNGAVGPRTAPSGNDGIEFYMQHAAPLVVGNVPPNLTREQEEWVLGAGVALGLDPARYDGDGSGNLTPEGRNQLFSDSVNRIRERVKTVGMPAAAADRKADIQAPAGGAQPAAPERKYTDQYGNTRDATQEVVRAPGNAGGNAYSLTEERKQELARRDLVNRQYHHIGNNPIPAQFVRTDENGVTYGADPNGKWIPENEWAGGQHPMHSALLQAASAGDIQTVARIRTGLYQAGRTARQQAVRQQGLMRGETRNMQNPEIAPAMYARGVQDIMANGGDLDALAAHEMQWGNTSQADLLRRESTIRKAGRVEPEQTPYQASNAGVDQAVSQWMQGGGTIGTVVGAADAAFAGQGLTETGARARRMGLRLSGNVDPERDAKAIELMQATWQKSSSAASNGTSYTADFRQRLISYGYSEQEVDQAIANRPLMERVAGNSRYVPGDDGWFWSSRHGGSGK